VGPLVAKGVTATLGTVAEPYLDGTPDMSVALGRLLYFGFSWGEAAVAAQRLQSWQLTVVGDPLYRPFRMNALERAKDLAARGEGRVDWAMVQLYNRKRMQSDANLPEVIRELEAEPRIRFSPILREKLGDFHREAGHSERAAEFYRSAASLLTSGQQQHRLAWSAAEELEAARKKREAYDAYRGLAKDLRAVADPILLLERLRQLAGTLGEKAEEARWTGELDRLRNPPK
jgi:hypothetical protein